MHTTMDPTEGVRRTMVAQINSDPLDREAAVEHYGQVWDTQELGHEFEVQALLAPYVTVKRKSDGVRGTMLFQHCPRLYYTFQEIR